MKVIQLNHMEEKISEKPHVMAIGFFDGVHLGHQELLLHAKEIAKKRGMAFSVMTFSPHPDEVIKGDKNKKYLMSLPQKISKMKDLGVEQLFVMNFDWEFAALSPADFVRKYILQSNTQHIVVGFDFTFGYKAKGDTEYLLEQSSKYGFGLSIIPKKTFLEEKISSTRIRKLVHDGNVASVPYYLGRNYEIDVSVLEETVTGRMKVNANDKVLLPAPGTYSVEVQYNGRVLRGKLNQYPDRIEGNKLILNEGAKVVEGACIISFLAKVKEMESMLI